MAARPIDVGIKAVDIYFPNQYVHQADLEKHDGVSEGKYTIGLGQTKMGFCSDREDIYSIALTAVSSLLRRYQIDPRSVGRLEVGTETILDKSKSVKTVLMQLFESCGNTNIEGVDTVNACYGGTNAFFNAVNWIESLAWDGRSAIVVAGDIAIYPVGAARPTGGAGCVAMLIGPNAPLVLEPGLRGSYFAHTYDFYKPNLTSEYAVVNGQQSINCYTKAVDECYYAYSASERRADVHFKDAGVPSSVANGVGGPGCSSMDTPLDRFDYMCFHAPTCKLVAKSYGRLLYNDYLEHPHNPMFSTVPSSMLDVTHEKSINDKQIEKEFVSLTMKRFAQRVQPSLEVASMCGNIYCGSVYGSIVSLLSNVSTSDLHGKRVGVFSYGSGLASSMFSLQVKGDTTQMRTCVGLHEKLASRQQATPVEFEEACHLRERAHLQKAYVPCGSVAALSPGTFYLTGIDDMFRRSYEIK